MYMHIFIYIYIRYALYYMILTFGTGGRGEFHEEGGW